MKNIVPKADLLAREEIETNNEPALIRYELSYNKAVELAEKFKADVDIIKIGASLMDIKLGACIKGNRVADHVKESKIFAEQFLKQFDLSKNTVSKILNCIEAHHKAVPFNSIEAEICANADCYRFIHPKGVLSFIVDLRKRFDKLNPILDQAEAKLDEKWSILSLDICKRELADYYKQFKKMFAEAREG
jgi:hypothetical protein